MELPSGEELHSRTHSFALGHFLFCQWDSARCIRARHFWLWIPSSGLTAALILALGGQCPWLSPGPCWHMAGVGSWHPQATPTSLRTLWDGWNGFILSGTDIPLPLVPTSFYQSMYLSISLFWSWVILTNPNDANRGCLLLNSSPWSKLWECQIQVGCTNSRSRLTSSWRNGRGQFWDSLFISSQPRHRP